MIAGTGLIFLYSKGHAGALVISSILAYIISYELKLFFAVPRPGLALVAVTGYRFPSMHAFVASAFFGSLCFSAFCLLRSPYKKVLVTFVCLSVVGIVGWSRVFLGAHLPIDVIVGVILGTSISLITHFFVLRKCYSIG
jgi:undecaprenyl-diphosphatase